MIQLKHEKRCSLNNRGSQSFEDTIRFESNIYISSQSETCKSRMTLSKSYWTIEHTSSSLVLRSVTLASCRLYVVSPIFAPSLAHLEKWSYTFYCSIKIENTESLAVLQFFQSNKLHVLCCRRKGDSALQQMQQRAGNLKNS